LAKAQTNFVNSILIWRKKIKLEEVAPEYFFWRILIKA